MRTPNQKRYAQRARKRFCKDTRFQAPVDLILSGQRTLEDWVEVLSEEREVEIEKNAAKTEMNRNKMSWMLTNP